MRIAVLLAGQYRTFPICRRTMTFLDDENVDVYMSVWDKSTYKHEELRIDITEDVTHNQVKLDIGKPATILIEKSEKFTHLIWIAHLLNRWVAGINAIQQSGINYDFVMIMRTNLFFNTDYPLCLEDICKHMDTNSFYGRANDNIEGFKLFNDFYFFIPTALLSFFKDALIENLTNKHSLIGQGYHMWMYSMLTDKAPLKKIPWMNDSWQDGVFQCVTCRPTNPPNYPFSDTVTFEEISKYDAEWWNAWIIKCTVEYGLADTLSWCSTHDCDVAFKEGIQKREYNNNNDIINQFLVNGLDSVLTVWSISTCNIAFQAVFHIPRNI